FAVFVAYRLYSVLGRRTGNEQPPFDPIRREPVETRRSSTASKDDNVVSLPRSRELPRAPLADSVEAKIQAGSPLAVGLDQIRDADRSFNPDAFVNGAKAAHEMIARAYAEGDRATLKSLLSDDVYTSFESAISTRERAQQKVDFSFIGLKQANLEEAGL